MRRRNGKQALSPTMAALLVAGRVKTGLLGRSPAGRRRGLTVAEAIGLEAELRALLPPEKEPLMSVNTSERALCIMGGAGEGLCIGPVPGRKRPMLYRKIEHESGYAVSIQPLASFASQEAADGAASMLAEIALAQARDDRGRA